MTNKMVQAMLLLSGLVMVVDARAERPHESDELANYVVTGKVAKVFARDRGDDSQFIDYVVLIRIDGVERGEGYREGDSIYAYAMRRKPGARTDQPGIGGHRGVPEEGQRIKAWIKRSRGQMEALYPKWFELLAPTEK